MRFRALASMISTANDYSLLKWPLLANSVLITFLAFMLLMCFQSSSWFTFETYDMRLVKSNKSIVEYPNSYEYSAFGLWSICTEKYSDMTVKCTTWIRQTRPQYFDVILILVSCAVLLANFAIFPSWALTILILYNIKNIYIRHIVVFLWIVFIFLLFITVLNISSLVLVGLTQYYSPGQFVTPTKYISFHNGSGLSYLVWGMSKTNIEIFKFIYLFIYFRNNNINNLFIIINCIISMEKIY
jgi:hypothetical protein